MEHYTWLEFTVKPSLIKEYVIEIHNYQAKNLRTSILKSNFLNLFGSSAISLS